MDKFIVAPTADNGKYPIQTQEPYHCPHCSAPIRQILHYNDYRNPASVWKPLDDFGAHLHYLNCSACGRTQRVARLGDAILPFNWPAGVNAKGEADHMAALLREIVQRVGPTGSQSDPAASVVYRLLAGTVAPQAAIEEVRQLVQFGVLNALDEHEPKFIFQDVTP